MRISCIILAHNNERAGNICPIVESLKNGTVKPNNIVVFEDNNRIEFIYKHLWITEIIASRCYPVITRFALGLCEKADRILMIDDDLAVGTKTIENFVKYANKYPDALLGLEGNILHPDDTECYTRGKTVDRGSTKCKVDILIRTYFATPLHLVQALWTRELFKEKLPEKSVDDIILCMSNKYFYSGYNIVIPVDKTSDVIELESYGVGQCLDSEHYINRNIACTILR